MKENRHHKRLTVDGIQAGISITRAKIINISFGGMAVESNKGLKPGKECTLKLEGKGNNVIKLTGMVVWSVLSASKKIQTGEIVPIYHAGIQFRDILTSKASELTNFIKKNMSITGEERLSGLRFKMPSDNIATVDYPHKYQVKLMSHSGMLLKTDQPFKPDNKMPMEITLPDGNAVKFTGRVASCLKAGKQDHFDVGVEFLDMSEKDRKRLHDFIISLNTI